MDDRTARLNLIKKKREERKKKRLKIFLKRLFIFLLVVGVITLAVLSLTVLFPITTIIVRNPEPYTAEQIVEKSEIEKGKNLFMSGRNAKDNIVTSLPYVSEIEITRKVPSTIIITATKAEPFVCFETEKGYLVCDKNYKLLEIKTELYESIVAIKGCKFKNYKIGFEVEFENTDAAKNAQNILKILEDKEYKILKLDITDLANITFEIDNRFIVKLGSAANMENKLSHLDEMIKNIDDGLKGNIDLSYWTEQDPRGIFKQATIK